MTWTRLSDDFPDRPELLLVGRSARLLHIEALVYCNKHTTDGLLPQRALGRITDSDRPLDDAAELTAAGLWNVLDAPPGWQIDWRDQEAGDDVRSRKATNAERQRRYRRHAAGDHSGCGERCGQPSPVRDADRDGPRHVTRDVTDDRTGHETAPRPVPSRPDPKESGRRRGASCDRCANGAPIAADGTCCGLEHDTPATRDAS